MTKSPVRPRAILSTIILAATVSTAAAQTNGTWTATAGGSWSSGLNWSGGAIADGVGAVADFSTLNITAATTVTLDAPRTVGTLRFGDLTTASHDWTLGAGTGGSLLLDTASGPAIIHVSNRAATISANITGAKGINVTGAGNLILTGANTHAGQVVVTPGATLTITNSGSSGATGVGNETIVQAGGVLNLAASNYNQTIGQEIIRIAGTGINNGGAIVSSVTNWSNIHNVILDANASIGGSQRYQFQTGTFNLNGFKLTKVGSNQIALTSGTITDGDIDVNAGNLSFEAGVIIRGSGTITVASGAVLGLWSNDAGTQTRAVAMNAGSILRELGSNVTDSTLSSPIALRGDITVDVLPGGGGLTNLTLPGGISESGGSFGFNKTGNGKLTLDGANTFTGTLNLNAGATVLGSAGTLSAGQIRLASGATLDVSPAGGFTVTGTQTLSAGRSGTAVTDITGNLTIGPGGSLNVGVNTGFQTLTLANSLTLDGAKVNFDVGSTTTVGDGVNDLIAVGENLTLAGTSTVTIHTLGASPAAGTYTLATYGGTLTGGASNISVAAPSNTRQTFTPDTTSTPGSVLLKILGNAGNITWVGGQNGNAWDVESTTNFTNGTTGEKFFNLDTVSFTDSGSNAAPVTISGELRPALVSVNATKNYEFGGTGKITGDAAITKAGSGKLTISGSSHDFRGGLTVTEGTVKVAVLNPAGTSGPLGTGPLTLAGGTLEYSGGGEASTREILLGPGGGTLNVSDQFSGLFLNVSPRGTTGFTKTGPGIFSANYVSNYTGGTTIAEGVFQMGNARALGAAANEPVIILKGGALDANGIILPAGTPKIALTMAGDGPDGLGALRNFGPVDVNNNNIAGSLTLSDNASIGTIRRYDFVGLSFIGGTFTLTKKGSGETWWQPAAGATVGHIVVEAGRFGVQSSDNLGSLEHSITVQPGAQLSTYNTATNSKPIIIDGGQLHNNSASTALGALGTWNGTLTLEGAGISNQINTMGGPIILNGKVTGSGGFEQLSTGGTAYRVELGSPDNDWQGETQITRGTLRIVGSGKFSAASLLSMNGTQATFDGANTAQTVAGLRGIAGAVTNVDLTVNQSTDDFFAGQITGTTSALTKAGTASLTLMGANTYQGTTTVQSGTLTVLGSISGSASVVVQDAGILRLGGDGQFTGGRIKDNASVVLGDSTPAGVPRIDLDPFGLAKVSEVMGTLSLQSNAVIDFGIGFGGELRFADSSSLTGSWSGILEIWNWTAGTDQIFFGSTMSGLTAAQLNRITFYSDEGDTSLGNAVFRSGGAGEIVPVPEPSVLHLGAAALGLGAWRRRRRA